MRAVSVERWELSQLTMFRQYTENRSELLFSYQVPTYYGKRKHSEMISMPICVYTNEDMFLVLTILYESDVRIEILR